MPKAAAAKDAAARGTADEASEVGAGAGAWAAADATSAAATAAAATSFILSPAICDDDEELGRADERRDGRIYWGAARDLSRRVFKL